MYSTRPYIPIENCLTRDIYQQRHISVRRALPINLSQCRVPSIDISSFIPNALYVDGQFANQANHPIALTLPAIQRPRSRFYWPVPATDFIFAFFSTTVAKL